MQEKMQKNTISNISVWLSNKLSGNDLWTNGSICSQLNKEVLRNIKEIFTDLQTQVKLKLLLSFFHIPRRLIDEWKNELDEILEVAAQDPELWVSMLSESMKTYPATGSLNTEISDYDHESRPIFTDMVTELKRLVNKANDLRALPLECQYLNKPALTALVGNQPTPVRHFVLKRKPKSSNLRMELMQKSADAQSSLKKTSAPTVPLRSRGLPRKMTDTTTPLKGIPSRVPSSGGFKTPTQAQSKNASSISRTTPAGRKDGGVKFLEIEDQPLGYAAAKKRKRQQELEEQQKRAAETEQQTVKTGEVNATNAAVTPDYAAGLTSVYNSQPATPMPAEISTSHFTTPTTPSITTATAETSPTIVTTVSKKNKNSLLSPKRMKFEDDIEEVKASSPTKLQQELPVKSVVISPKESVKGETKIVKVTRTLPTLIAQQQNNAASTPKSIVLTQTTQSPTIGSSYVTIKAVSAANSQQQSTLSHLNIPSNTIVRTVQYVTTQAQAQTSNNLVASTAKSPPNAVTIQKPTLIAKTNASGKPTILSNIVLTPNMRATTAQTSQAQPGTSYVISSSPNNKIVQRVVVSSGQNINLPTLTTRTAQPTIIQPLQQGTPTKIVQIKTTPTILGMAQNQNSSTIQNIPPLISTQQPTLLNIQNIQNPAQRKTVTLTAQPQTTASGGQQQGQKVNQIIVPSGGLKGKTIIVSNQNQNQQINLGGRNVILQSVGASGTPIYQQIPISSALATQNVPQLVLANTSQGGQQTQTVPRLITNLAAIQPQSSTSNQVQIRPVLTAVPQGGGQLTLIQRPGQQAQLVQQIVPQTIQKTIITRPAQVVQVQQTQQATQQGQTTVQANAGAKAAGTAAANNAAGQRRGLSLSSKHVAVASEMFKKANRVTRLDKALILGFMAGYRDNPRPNADNVITIKLNESKEQVKQPDNTIVPMLVDTLIRLDYNTGEWKTFRTFRKITQQQQNEAAAQQQSQSSVAT